ncbi:EamA family transporter [Marinitoga sp. 38H-ov]|uniref:EamA family transporter n=1 Tax=Marinitoga sp. 38H-ov TaxID=1755814 RepID=UPI0013E9F8DD|nr:EamA family transporter [Marinitoga sp. 38H-ov]KAF2956289.1 hypothetical protein AS160_06140 [Marinitoga sp. 38H-ov]
MIICAISFSLYIVLITKFSKKIKEIDLLTFHFFTVAVIGMIFSFLFKINIYITTFSFFTIIYSEIVGSIIVRYLQLKHQKNVGNNLIALIFLVQPISSSMLSKVILNEIFTKNQII